MSKALIISIIPLLATLSLNFREIGGGKITIPAFNPTLFLPTPLIPPSAGIGISGAATLNPMKIEPSRFLPKGTPEIPRDIPDFAEAERNRGEYAESWNHIRSEIIGQRIGGGPEVDVAISALNERNAEYLKRKELVLQSTAPGATIATPEVFEKLRKLNQEYRDDVKALIGENAVSELDRERHDGQERYAMGPYRIPTDLY